MNKIILLSFLLCCQIQITRAQIQFTPEQQAVIQKYENQKIAQKRARLDSLRNIEKGYPVLGIQNDTLFNIYTSLGEMLPYERAQQITQIINELYRHNAYPKDSIVLRASEYTVDLVCGTTLVMRVSELDAEWQKTTMENWASEVKNKIHNTWINATKQNAMRIILLRVGLVLLVLIGFVVLIWLTNRGYGKVSQFIAMRQEKWLKDLSYKKYVIFSTAQQLRGILWVLRCVRWFFYLLILYMALTIIFSIFPVTYGWAYRLFQLCWIPLKGAFVSILHYLPKLFTILVIYFVMRYFLRLVRYIFQEIENGKLKITGFYTDWAKPTYSIVRFLLYAFMLVLIYPDLPGSNSAVFKGISVFLGILFSFGSSSAITNIVAGFVITYMRPFKVGDVIKIGDITGRVKEKTLLVTRLKTPKNEEITIPNSSVLTGNTLNYSLYAKKNGVILNTIISLGYDVPWRDLHKILIEAALKTPGVLKEPKPFILQVGLDNFYVSYQINIYTHHPENMLLMLSQLYENIQDLCNENGIEIMSPAYYAARDGNKVTIPKNYLPKDYKPPSFNVEIPSSQPSE